MYIKKLEYINILEKIKNIYLKYSTDKAIINNIDDTIKCLEEYKLKIVLIGKFNAGKTCILNTLLNRYVLEENTSPETSIATELFYTDKNEHAEFLKKDTSILKLSLDEALNTKVSSRDFYYAKYYVNNNFLLENNNIIFVDMPGINSNIEDHNKAIIQYIDQAGGYIFVISSEDGDINNESIGFLKEIKNYNSCLAVAITKSDRKLKDIENIKNKIKDTVENIFKEKIECVYFNRDDNDIKEKILHLVNSMNFDVIFESKFKPLLLNIKSNISVYLESIKDGLYFNDYELNNQIRNLEQEKKDIEEQITRQEYKLHNKIFNEDIPNILVDFERELVNNAKFLASYAANGDAKKFEQSVIDILRPIWVSSVNNTFNNSFHHFVQGLEIKTKGIIEAKNITNRIKNVFSSVTQISKHIEENTKKIKKSDNDDNSIKYSKETKNLLAGLAIATDVVAPWMELIIVFLPDILNLVFSIESKLKLDDLESKIVVDVIPQIVNRVKIDIDNNFKEMETEGIKKIKEEAKKLIQSKEDAINSIKNKSEEERKKYETNLSQLNIDIENINNIMI
ncbi:dynamin family protein [Brachyspira pilosicoli]|uniref:Dynamin N-terminal domain-containing protein n=1 Tax=Brachyspira pilosicoli TaxID=52584 RepID=A0A5C8F8L6_BRAPL|nr:dynamin family protein [Brachyspira pilosicoli]TXJ44950.1 hypothetical protein EPJ72_03135 [Brachyspira pilosicoli]